MSKSPRQTVSLTTKQHDWLKRKADRLGITVSELIRRIVDEYREEQEK